MVTGDPFWQHLLRQRAVARWGNFNWFSAKTLLMSLNDQVAKAIESGQPGSIVDRRRMSWVAKQRDRGVRCEVPIRLPDTKGMLLLGDTGEMDASQYVLVRDLSLVSAALRDVQGIDTALLMSDVVYPAGDINQWADAVYLPYFGLPAESWKQGLGRIHGHGRPPPPAPLDGFNVLAMPGNHDWYDGLNGFMYHACGTEPLADVKYDEAGLTRRQRLAKFSWRSPTPPERERVTKLRADAARLSPRPLGAFARGVGDDPWRRLLRDLPRDRRGPSGGRTDAEHAEPARALLRRGPGEAPQPPGRGAYAEREIVPRTRSDGAGGRRGHRDHGHHRPRAGRLAGGDAGAFAG